MADLSKYWKNWPHSPVEEGRAEDILLTCARKRGMHSIPVPVPVEEWIEGPLHINFEVRDLSDLGEDVIGGAWCNDPTILVSDKIENQNGRFRFTCAHELGHVVLHKDLGMRFEDGDETMFTRDRGVEAQANRFASRFLMPWGPLQSEVIRALQKFGMDPRNDVPKLLGTDARSIWLWKHRILPDITKCFDVSLSAAIYRFHSIRLPYGYRLLPQAIIQPLLTSDWSNKSTFEEILLEVGR